MLGQVFCDPKGLGWPGAEDPFELVDELEAVCRDDEPATAAHAAWILLSEALCAIQCRQCREATCRMIEQCLPDLIDGALAEPAAVEKHELVIRGGKA